MYNNKWTEFEVHAMCYGILRKHLYPGYLVRGEHRFPCGNIPDISVWKANKDEEPTLKFTIEVKRSALSRSELQGKRYEESLGVPCVYIRGKEDAYKIISKVSHLL